MPTKAPTFRPGRTAQATRPTANDRGYDYRWQKARAAFLRAHPLCRSCQSAGRIESATVVDHIKPHRGNDALFWDHDNWQALCKACHDRKTRAGS